MNFLKQFSILFWLRAKCNYRSIEQELIFDPARSIGPRLVPSRSQSEPIAVVQPPEMPSLTCGVTELQRCDIHEIEGDFTTSSTVLSKSLERAVVYSERISDPEKRARINAFLTNFAEFVTHLRKNRDLPNCGSDAEGMFVKVGSGDDAKIVVTASIVSEACSLLDEMSPSEVQDFMTSIVIETCRCNDCVKTNLQRDLLVYRIKYGPQLPERHIYWLREIYEFLRNIKSPAEVQFAQLQVQAAEVQSELARLTAESAAHGAEAAAHRRSTTDNGLSSNGSLFRPAQ
ncbi:MAG: hypothetical protein LBI34_01785 [Puniceicoccales bacterium]|nr:hypothetical protein [Puniceicoccales bacterium]